MAQGNCEHWKRVGTTRSAPQVAGSGPLGTLVALRDDTLGAYLHAHLYAVFSPAGAQRVLGTRAADFRKENAVRPRSGPPSATGC